MSSADEMGMTRTDLFTKEDLLARFTGDNYVAIALVFAISLTIGVYQWYRGKKTTEDFCSASRKMTTLPATLSVVATTFSSVAMLGLPVSAYLMGMKFSIICVGIIPSSWLAAKYYIPVFYNLKVTTSLEYLTLRFGPIIYSIVIAVNLLTLPMLMAVEAYALGLYLSLLTGVSDVIATGGVLAVCLLYTSISGLRGVMWTDTFQCFVMLSGFLVVTIIGIYKVGSPAEVFDRSYESGRLAIFDFETDPRVQLTFWSMLIGGFFYYASYQCTAPTLVQRYNSCKELKTAQRAVKYAAFWGILYILFPLITGLVAYSFYHDCDPLTTGQLNTPDQIIPHLVLTIMGDKLFLSGIFVAGVLAATLSTMSTLMNTTASIIYVDFIKVVNKDNRFFKVTDGAEILIVKLLCVLVGLVAYGYTFLAKDLPTILDSALMVNGIFQGPIFAIFTLGIFIPFASKRGAVAGLLVGVILMAWIGFGSFIAVAAGTFGSSTDKPLAPLSPLSKENCPDSWAPAIVVDADPTTAAPEAEPSSFPHLAVYDVFYMWHTFIGFVITMTVGILASCVSPQDVRKLDPRLVSEAVPGSVKSLTPAFTKLGEKCENYWSEIGTLHTNKEMIEEDTNENDTTKQHKESPDDDIAIDI